MELARPTTPNF